MAVRPRSPALAPLLVLAIAAFTPICAPPRATAQTLELAPKRAYTPFASVDLDGGAARSLETSRWLLLGAATAGLGLYDGSRIWSLSAGLRGVRGDERAALVTVSRSSVETGIGLHAGALWDLGRDAAGAAVGLSWSLLNLEGDLLFDGPRTRYVLLFIRVPVGFLTYIALGGRR